MSIWNEDSIRAKQAEKAVVIYENADRDALIKRIVDLETALYPFAYCLGSIDSEAWRGTDVSSKLFPMLDDDGTFMVWEDGKQVNRKTIPENQLHSVEYYTHDSMTIMDGSLLDDRFELLGVHQQAPGAYVGCGSICMGDVRRATALLWPKKPEDEPS